MFEIKYIKITVSRIVYGSEVGLECVTLASPPLRFIKLDIYLGILLGNFPFLCRDIFLLISFIFDSFQHIQIFF